MVLGGGCVARAIDEPSTTSVEQFIGGDCDEFQCGTNSPQIAEFGFWELNLPLAAGTLGLPNNIGIQVRGFVKDGISYVPKVFGGRLSATWTSPVPPYVSVLLIGNELVGGAFELVNGDRSFLLKIAEVDHVESWAQPPTGAVVLESYKLDWAEVKNGLPDRFVNACKNPPGRENPDSLTMRGALSFHTLLFEGDRIDATKKLDTGVDLSWVNLGCAGSALAKMALTGHTEASANALTFATTLPERQAMLKMLTADYCGGGKPFTVGGQPLNWRDDHGTMQLAALTATPPQPLVLESRWTENGAACLEKPRVDVHWTQAGDKAFGDDVYRQVQRHCSPRLLPPCTDGSFDTAGYHLLTATVPFQP
jgi:hypothetical protein